MVDSYYLSWFLSKLYASHDETVVEYSDNLAGQLLRMEQEENLLGANEVATNTVTVPHSTKRSHNKICHIPQSCKIVQCDWVYWDDITKERYRQSRQYV